MTDSLSKIEIIENAFPHLEGIDVKFYQLSKEGLSVDSITGKKTLHVIYMPKGFLLKTAAKKIAFIFKVLTGSCFNVKTLKEKPAPVIIISDFDITDTEGLKREDNHLDPRYRFIDSSIWCRYVQYDANEAVFNARLEKVLASIKIAYEFDLYNKIVCKEFIEFQVRELNNSFLKSSFGDNHARLITPYKFHSETLMEKKADELYEKFVAKNIKWNYLLVDDFSHLQLRKEKVPISCKRESKECCSADCSCKENIVRTWINYPKPAKEDSIISKLDCEINVKKAKARIEKEEEVYDIILLDYLFSEPEQTEYGFELLEAISKGEELTKGKSILQNYWIYPISAFPEAMISDLQEKSIQYIEKDWQLVRGASPINTPHLFRNGLFELMQTQVDRIYFTEKDVLNLLLRNSLNEKSMKESIHGLYRKTNELLGRVEGLPTNSAFSETIQKLIQNEENRGKRLLQHINQLLFLLMYPIKMDRAVTKNELRILESLISDDHRQSFKDFFLDKLSSYLNQ